MGNVSAICGDTPSADDGPAGADLLHQDVLHREPVEANAVRFALRVPDADDLLALDEHPPALVAFGQEPGHLTEVEVPLRGQWPAHCTRTDLDASAPSRTGL